jgi:CRP/FNR family transcriptional regulator, cyclic AMP receptor protein
MVIGSGIRSLSALGTGTSRECFDEALALYSAVPHQLGGSANEPVGRPPGGPAAEPLSLSKDSKRMVRDGLAESDVFGALADDELNRLIGQGRTMTYRSSAIVFRKGDLANDFMMVLCGRIRLSSVSRHGREVLFDLIGPGRCFGEGALIDGATRKFDARAVKPSAVFMLRRGDMLACLEAHHEVAVRIIRVLCVRLSRAMEMFEHRTQLGLATRSARMLLHLAREYGDGTRIELRISQAEIAGLVGATREKVNRQLRDWCRSGILAFDEGHLMILDPSALRAIAEGD